MADTENIGGIAVDIVGNYAPLATDLEEAVQMASKAGQEIATSLNQGAAAADQFSGAITAASTGMGDFETRIAALVNSGSTLAEALAAVEGGTAGVGAAATQAAQQMELFDAAVQVPYADAAGQLNLFATALEPIGPAAQQATTATQGLGDAGQRAGEQATTAGQGLKDFGDKAKTAGESSTSAAAGAGDLLQQLMKFAGIGLSIEALKSFTEETINLYASAQRAGEGIAFLRGNIADADNILQGLRATAQSLAIPFDSVTAAAQKMAFFKLSAEETASAIEVASDAAKASGKSFTQMADSLSNIALSGMAMPRTLRQIGVEASDLAAVLNVTTEHLKKVFSAMGESDRLNALIAAMDRTRGATQAMAHDTESELTRMKNSFEFAMTDMGSAVAPLAVQAIPSLVDAFRYLVSGAALVLTGMKFVGDSIAGIVSIATTAAMGLGKVWFDVITHDFSGAAQAAKDAYNDIKAAGQFTWESLIKDAQQGVETIDKIWQQQVKTADTVTDAQRAAGAAAAAAAAQAALAAIEAAKELKKETAEVEAFAKAIAPALAAAGQSYEDYVASLYEGGKKASSILSQLTTDIAKGEAEAAKMSGAPKAAMEEWIAKLKEAQATMNNFAAEDAMTKAWAEILDKREKYAAKVAEEAEKINEQMVADQQKAALMEEQGELVHQEKLLEIQRTAAAEEAKIHNITAFDKLALDQEIDTKEAALAQNALRRELQILDDTNTAEVNYASKREAIMLRIQALQDKTDGKAAVDAINRQTEAYKILGLESDKALITQIREADQALGILVQQGAAVGLIYAGEEKRLDLQIKLAEQSGASATAQIVGLENIKLHQEALMDQTRLLGDMYVGIERDILKGWDQLGKSIADNIIEEQNWGKVMLDVGKQVGKMILEELVGTAFKALKDAIVGIGTASGGMLTTVVHDVKAMEDAINQAIGVTSAGAGAKSGAGAAGGGGGLTGGGGLLGTAGAIGSIVSAIEGAFGLAQMSHLISTAGKIEENTRRMDIVFEKFAQQDSWDQQNGIVATLDMIFNRLGDIWTAIMQNGVGGGSGEGGASGPPPAGGRGGAVLPPGWSGGQPTGRSQLPPAYQPFTPPPVFAPPTVLPPGGTAPGTIIGGTQTFHITVNETSNPRETARQLADTLRTLSGKFSAYGQ